MIERLNLDSLKLTAQRLLTEEPGPIVRYRLLRDVMLVSSNDRHLMAARPAASRSKWIQQLAAEQRSDGSWGRFHSQDTRAHQRIVTTEAAVDRALDLGLQEDHPILSRAATYIRNILRGTLPFPDPAEKNDRWPTGTRLFAAATLCRIHPRDRSIDPVWRSWAEVLRRTFSTGSFNPQRQLAAHQEVHGVSEVGYLALSTRYAAALLGARSSDLPRDISAAYARYLWRLPNGLGYVGVPLGPGPRALRRCGPVPWFKSVALVTLFNKWHVLAKPNIERLWDARGADDSWDLGPVPPHAWLSENPHLPQARRHDWSLRVLVLLHRYCQAERSELASGSDLRVAGRTQA